MNRMIQKGGFRLRMKWYSKLTGSLRRIWLSALGMTVGRRTTVPAITVTWPHQVKIGSDCQLERDIRFKFDGIWKPGPSIRIGNHVFIGYQCEFNIRKGISIGDHSNIASGCHFIDHDHGKSIGNLIGSQFGGETCITIGKDVWLGCNVIVLQGVEIGDGAIVGAGAVVNRSVLPFEIWAGVPAKKIGERSRVPHTPK